MRSLKTSRVEALAEIFDFVAGLVQRVPKKTNEVKTDLQNSTARLWNLEGSATGDEYDGEIDVRLRLRGESLVSRLMEADCFSYDKFSFYFSHVGFIVDLYGKICIVSFLILFVLHKFFVFLGGVWLRVRKEGLGLLS